jgi:N-succinyldiaminopimelate aminotransferase
MNPRLGLLQPYPFERLRRLLNGVTPDPALSGINLSIGEPKHPTPRLIVDALLSRLEGLASYPATAGTPALREAIATWLQQRFGLTALDPSTQVLPVNGSREALFAFAQAIVDPTRRSAKVVCPNPFYQIYEGATLLAGASPVYLNATPSNAFHIELNTLTDSVWREVQLVYACSPANPSGVVLTIEEWRRLFALSDEYGFVIASDECYSELYNDEVRPPVGALEAATRLGRSDFKRLVVFGSLSKRSNVPGMRSGYVAGNAEILQKFLLYRTYHGSAMSLPVQHASIAAWRDEAHVRENRLSYTKKFRAVLPLVPRELSTEMPEGGFYLWIRTPIDDTEFVRRLYGEYNVLALPGSYLAREAHGENPGRGFVRIALVPPLADCVEAMHRIQRFATSL